VRFGRRIMVASDFPFINRFMMAGVDLRIRCGFFPAL
jgi:hypothetical protein